MFNGIQFKLWLTIAIILCLSLSATFAITHWRFKENFLNYVNQKSDHDAEIVAQFLITNYQITREWVDYSQKNNQWRNLCFKALYPHRSANLEKKGISVDDTRPLPDNLAMREFCRTAFVVAASGQVVMGNKQKKVDYSWLELFDPEGEMIGKLAYERLTHIANVVDQIFVRQHRMAFISIGTTVFIIASILTLWLSRRLTKPIRQLSLNAQELTKGNFKVKAKVLSHDELGILCRKFNELAQTLDANLKTRQEWLADISHEMRTPIAVIQGQIEAMSDGVRPLDPPNLAIIQHKVTGLKRLIEDLHELSLSDLGALSYRKQPLSVKNALNDVIESFDTRFSELPGLQVTTAIALEEHDIVLADNTRIQQLIMNLIENSCRYTDQPGKIEVSAHRQEQHIEIIVRDSAPAVPDDAIPKLFDKLYRVESSRNRQTGGSGLGLSICKNIVEAHFGSVIARASQLGGLEMVVTLPAQ